MKYRIITFAVTVAFVWYWASTLLLTLPNCFIKINVLSYTNKFHEFFGQRWNFFAPPPTFNNRLYYTFYNKKDSTILSNCEVLKTITQSKHEARPFNWKEEVLDYTLNNALVDFNDMLREVTDFQKMKNPQLNDTLLQEPIMKQVRESWGNNFPSQVLHNYARRIAEERGYMIDDCLLKVMITKIPIPKFADREKQPDITEYLVYETPLLPLNMETRYIIKKSKL